MPKLLAFTRYGRLGASSRVRFLQYQKSLESVGYQVCIRPLLSDRYLKVLYKEKKRSGFEIALGYIRRCIDLLRIPWYECIWIEKELFPGFPAIVERLLHFCKVHVVVDYDDAIFHNYDTATSYILRRFLQDKIAVVMRSASVVVAGNPYIAEYARTARAAKVRILPSVVDMEQYAVAPRKIGPPLVIGWIGSPTTVQYLSRIVPALQAAHRLHPFEFVVIGAEVLFAGLTMSCKPWSEETEIQEIQQFDIGIMPLPDEPWTRGKCGYKLIQYMACGIAVVGSPVGVNQEIISEDVGFAPNSMEAWESAIVRLLGDAELRLGMGIKGRLRAEHLYSLRGAANELCALLARPCT